MLVYQKVVLVRVSFAVSNPFEVAGFDTLTVPVTFSPDRVALFCATKSSNKTKFALVSSARTIASGSPRYKLPNAPFT